MTRWALIGVLAMLAAGCAPATRVVLLPQPDGKAGAVEVGTESGRAVLSRPYEDARVLARGRIETGQTDASRVQARYGQLLAAQPAREQRFTLLFEIGGVQLTPESLAELQDVLAQAMMRPGGEIVVTGHTDRVGTVGANDGLSLQRARAIREMLIQRGFDPRRVQAVGRGEREPVAPTDDEVAEPRNRRTEIVVR